MSLIVALACAFTLFPAAGLTEAKAGTGRYISLSDDEYMDAVVAYFSGEAKNIAYYNRGKSVCDVLDVLGLTDNDWSCAVSVAYFYNFVLPNIDTGLAASDYGGTITANDGSVVYDLSFAGTGAGTVSYTDGSEYTGLFSSYNSSWGQYLKSGSLCSALYNAGFSAVKVSDSSLSASLLAQSCALSRGDILFYGKSSSYWNSTGTSAYIGNDIYNLYHSAVFLGKISEAEYAKLAGAGADFHDGYNSDTYYVMEVTDVNPALKISAFYTYGSGYPLVAFVPTILDSGGSDNSGACENYETDYIKGFVNESEVNLRSGPGTEYSSYGLMSYKSDVKIYGEETGSDSYIWYKITCNNISGYMRSDFITVTSYAEAFVERLYEVVLGRSGDSSGIAHWTDMLCAGKISAAEVAESFFKSDEYSAMGKSNSDIVEDCYKAMLGRASDSAGKEHWLKYLEAGMTVSAICSGFAGSAEFKSLCSDYGLVSGSVTLSYYRDLSYNRTKFVHDLYKNCLSREPETAGLEGWCKKLSSGFSGTSLVKSFVQSTEYLNKNVSNEEYVSMLYKATLGRDADSAGYAGWVHKLNSGATRSAVLSGFTSSAEFAKKCSAAGISVK